jgi:hypothetical protein
VIANQLCLTIEHTLEGFFATHFGVCDIFIKCLIEATLVAVVEAAETVGEVDFVEDEEVAGVVVGAGRPKFESSGMCLLQIICYIYLNLDSDSCSRDPNAPPVAADLQLMNMENTYMAATKGLGGIANLSMSSQMPPRPDHGTLGKIILVYANYFKVIVPNDLTLTRYNVEVTPEAKGKKLGRVFQLLLELPAFTGVATEWKSMIVSSRPLNIPPDFSVQIPYLAEGQDQPLAHAITYTIRVVTPLSFSISSLVNHLSSVTPGPDFVQKAEIIQVLNAVFGHHPQSHDGVVSIGQNRHFSIDRSQQNAHNIRSLTGGLESLRGYFQSVRSATGGLLLNVNVTHGVFLEPITLSLLYPKLGTGNKITLQKKLKLVRVKVTHLPGKKSKKNNQNIPRVKTIFGLAHTQDGRTEEHPPRVSSFGAGPKNVQFWLSDVPPAAAGANPPTKGKAAQKGVGKVVPTNTYISVFDYFRRSESFSRCSWPKLIYLYLEYPQIPLDDRSPVVNVGNRENPSYLPAEVCEVLPGQTIKRRLSPEQTQAMITFACRKPFENGNSIVGDGKAVLGLNPAANSLAVCTTPMTFKTVPDLYTEIFWPCRRHKLDYSCRPCSRTTTNQI